MTSSFLKNSEEGVVDTFADVASLPGTSLDLQPFSESLIRDVSSKVSSKWINNSTRYQSMTHNLSYVLVNQSFSAGDYVTFHIGCTFRPEIPKVVTSSDPFGYVINIKGVVAGDWKALFDVYVPRDGDLAGISAVVNWVVKQVPEQIQISFRWNLKFDASLFSNADAFSVFTYVVVSRARAVVKPQIIPIHKAVGGCIQPLDDQDEESEDSLSSSLCESLDENLRDLLSGYLQI